MAFDAELAERVRLYLIKFPKLEIKEKKMFRGLAFIVNGKMCINVSNDNLMCRFDPDLAQEVLFRKGFLPMIMKGKEYKGYCYVEPIGLKSKKDFEFWIDLCIDFNHKAESSKKKK